MENALPFLKLLFFMQTLYNCSLNFKYFKIKNDVRPNECLSNTRFIFHDPKLFQEVENWPLVLIRLKKM
jgi:hypothetical protein